MLIDLLLWVISEIINGKKKEEIIVVYFPYSWEYCDGFIGHKSINSISSSSTLNKQHNSATTTHAEKYEMISQLPTLTFATCVLNLYM